MDDLGGKVVVITGSCSGIGLEIAKNFKRYNSSVVLTYFDKDKDQQKKSVHLMNDNNFDQCLGIDVTDKVSVRACFNSVFKKFGKLDILVNNAGINLVGDFDAINDEMWQRVIDTNLKGPFICMREVYEFISRGGKVVNIGSVSGQYGGPRTTSYACAKAGVMALTHCFARYAGPRKDVSVNCVSPGPIKSEMLDLMPEKILDELKEDLLIKRLGTMKEVADLVCFLSSEKSSFITGQTIGINGGVWV